MDDNVPGKEEQEEKKEGNTLLTEGQDTLYFEYYKHLTTLNAAGALFLLAIYRELGIVTSRIAMVLTMFAISLVVSGLGLLYLLWHAGDHRRGVHFWLTFIASNFLLGGVIAFTLLSLTR